MKPTMTRTINQGAKSKKRKRSVDSGDEVLEMAVKKRPSPFNPVGGVKKVRTIDQFLDKMEDPNYW